MDNEKESILYSPNLQYDKNYYTEDSEIKNFYDNDNNNKDDSDNKDSNDNNTLSKFDQVQDTINMIDKLLPLLPEFIVNVYLPPYIEMGNEFEDIKNSNKDNNNNNNDNNNEGNSNGNNNNNGGNSNEDLNNSGNNNGDSNGNGNNNGNSNGGGNGTVGDDNDNNKNFYPVDPFYKGEDVYADIEDPLADYSKVIVKQYYQNFLDIYKDYLDKLYRIINDFILSIIESTMANPLKDNPLDYKTTGIRNPQLWHLSDYLCKSNIYLDQQIRLHRKLFDLDESILHIRQLKISKEQVKRYYEINEMREKSKFDFNSNLVLEESRKVAKKKYKENLKNLYKYLNSSVILLDESLNLLKKQSESITTINKYEKRVKK